jgi:thiamine transport system substrate-binding protein
MKSSVFSWIRLISLMFFIACVSSSCKWNAKEPTLPEPAESVRVLTYASLASKDGLLESIRKDWVKQSQCGLKIETVPAAGQVLQYLKDRSSTVDWVLGLDTIQYLRASDYFEDSEGFRAIRAEVSNQLKEIIPPSPKGWVSFEYSALTLIYQKSKLKSRNLEPPKTLTDLLLPQYRKQFILQDPRLSSPGLELLLAWPKHASLKDLSKQWLLIAQSWDPSYQLFLQGEAPIIWSYITSWAYHESKGQGADFGYVDFPEGLPLQIEGLVRVKHDVNLGRWSRCDTEWVRFMLSDRVQSQIAEKQFMLPVTTTATVPAHFSEVSKFKHFTKSPVQSALILKAVDEALLRFSHQVQGDMR